MRLEFGTGEEKTQIGLHKAGNGVFHPKAEFSKYAGLNFLIQLQRAIPRDRKILRNY